MACEQRGILCICFSGPSRFMMAPVSNGIAETTINNSGTSVPIVVYQVVFT